MQGDVVAVVDVDGSALGGVPCEDDGAGGPGFAEAVGWVVGIVAGRVLGIGEGGGVDDDGVEAGVAFVFSTDGEEAGLGGDRDADLVGNFYAALSFETDFCEEEFDVVFEAFAKACGKFGYEGYVCEEDFVPGLGKVCGDDLAFLGSEASGEEVLAAEEQGGDAKENEKKDE